MSRSHAANGQSCRYASNMSANKKLSPKKKTKTKDEARWQETVKTPINRSESRYALENKTPLNAILHKTNERTSIGDKEGRYESVKTDLKGSQRLRMSMDTRYCKRNELNTEARLNREQLTLGFTTPRIFRATENYEYKSKRENTTSKAKEEKPQELVRSSINAVQHERHNLESAWRRPLTDRQMYLPSKHIMQRGRLNENKENVSSNENASNYRQRALKLMEANNQLIEKLRTVLFKPNAYNEQHVRQMMNVNYLRRSNVSSRMDDRLMRSSMTPSTLNLFEQNKHALSEDRNYAMLQKDIELKTERYRPAHDFYL
eukprot:TRINITY_DN10812_c0_g2_i2.p1 TRINITY_DN10812_c0_g2~~TRINITY_DN10812_c0_g2_i2.p1  ORF type:complete len:317 (+),score=42.33 TRINITY_DN10812_c0_g2_i2:409-1359(+)